MYSIVWNCITHFPESMKIMSYTYLTIMWVIQTYGMWDMQFVAQLKTSAAAVVAVVARPEAAPEDANVATRSPPKSPRAADPGDIFMKLFKNITDNITIIE